MANEEFTGLLEGVSSGLNRAISQRLNQESLDVRREFNETNRERNNLLRDRMALETSQANSPIMKQKLEAMNAEKAERVKKLEFENAKAAEEEAKRNKRVDPMDIATQIASGSPVPATIQAMEDLLRSSFPGRDINSISQFEFEELSKKAANGEAPEFYEKMNTVLDVSIEQADNKRKAFERDFQKAIEKDPFLADNPEARKSIPKVFEMEQGIEGLKHASDLFFARKQQIVKLQEQIEEDRRRREVYQETLEGLSSLQKPDTLGLTGEAKNQLIAGRNPEARTAVDAAIEAKLQRSREQGTLGLRSGERTLSSLSGRVKELAGKLFQSESFKGRIKESLQNIKDLITQEGDRAVSLAAYRSLVRGTIGQFRRVIGGEKGVMTEQDAARIQGLFPDPFGLLGVVADRKEVAEEKLRVFDTALENIRKEILLRQGITPKGKIQDVFKSLESQNDTIDIGNRTLDDMSLEELKALREQR